MSIPSHSPELPPAEPPASRPVAPFAEGDERLPAAPSARHPEPRAGAVPTLSAKLSPELLPELQHALSQAGWAQATPVQALAVPVMLAGTDVFLLAPTGSGKTVAFLLPLLQHLLQGPVAQRPRRLAGLVLSPTRELAQQTTAAAQRLAPSLKVLCAVGGLSIQPQMMALRGGAHLLVATPGRLLDLHRHHALSLADVEFCVFDEADRLLDLGFADDMQQLRALLPRALQQVMCSATLPPAVRVLAHEWLRAPQTLDLRPGLPDPDPDPGLEPSASGPVAPPFIEQHAVLVDTARRTSLLHHLLATQAWSRTLVFVATQRASERVAGRLRQAGWPAAALHGQLSPGRRQQALADLQDGRLAVLVATDLAARGLDVPGLSAVVNHDLPRSADDHTHRIGRTGRAGACGVAYSFICADAPGSEAHFRLIEKRQQQRVPRERIPGFEPQAVAAPVLHADPHGGVKGQRMSKKDKLRAAAAQTAADPARR